MFVHLMMALHEGFSWANSGFAQNKPFSEAAAPDDVFICARFARADFSLSLNDVTQGAQTL